MRSVVATVLALGAIPVLADTVTTIDRESINGSIVELGPERLVMHASSAKGQSVIHIPRHKLRSIEFNDNRFNRGAPPPYYQAGAGAAIVDDNGKKTKPAPAPEDGDVLVLKRGAGTRKCGVARVTDSTVTCGSETFKRPLVHSIRIGHE